MTAAGPVVTVTIKADGSTVVSVAGAPGPSCRTLTAALERALGQTTGTLATAGAQQHAGQTAQQTGGGQ